jgi:hypothetical protein
MSYQTAHDRDAWRSIGAVQIFAFCSPILSRISRYTRANHNIYMRFERREQWHVAFFEAGLHTELPRKLVFTSPGKILELARKGEAWGTLENRQSLERAIEAGQGGCYLRLTPAQYARCDALKV